MWVVVVRRDTSRLPEQSETQLGDYRALRKLGEGGFGSVVEAERSSTGERVALKELARISPDALARFKQEFRALQGLHHPNLVRLEELFEHEGRWFIAMALVDGCDWLEWVRPREAPANDNAAPFDAVRLRDTLGDITRGLGALHEAGFVHRDLKPANIRVTKDGRAVLLDFGLLTHADVQAQSTHGAGIGTVAYMAPEQAAGQKVGPSADWYALGTSLYEALTGRLPFTGEHVLAVMMAKQGKLPCSPSEACGDPIPKSLEDLAMHLLAPLPDDRAGGGDVLEAVAADFVNPSHAQTQLIPTVGVPFSGRTGELRTLAGAFDRALRGDECQVLIEGESGIGKSALVEEFIREVTCKHPAAVVLRGRCYENESVPFKGMDGVMDSLARYLRRLPESQCEKLLPRHAKLISELFPVMGGVRSIADKPLRDVPTEPLPRRRAAIVTLSELLGAIRDHHPLVVVVDDLQWADDESFPILDSLVGTSGVLLVFTVRLGYEVPEDLRPALDHLRAFPTVQTISLGALKPAEARGLAAQLLGPAKSKEWVSHVVEEAAGHPLFLAELVRRVHSADTADDLADFTLDGVLGGRIQALSEPARSLLQLIACAQSPKPLSTLRQAAPDSQVGDFLSTLKAQNLVRSTNRGRVQTYHDKVRAVVLEALPEQDSRELHLRWARALASTEGVDAAEVGRHFELAGVVGEALVWLEQGADRAFANLGFSHAERLYTRCLELGGAEAERAARHRWLVRRAEACTASGQLSDAIASFQQAADLTDEADVRASLLLRMGYLSLLGLRKGHSARLYCAEAWKLHKQPVPREGPRRALSALWHLCWFLALAITGFRRGSGAGKPALQSKASLYETTGIVSVYGDRPWTVLSMQARFSTCAHLLGTGTEHVTMLTHWGNVLALVRLPWSLCQRFFDRAHAEASYLGDRALRARVRYYRSFAMPVYDMVHEAERQNQSIVRDAICWLPRAEAFGLMYNYGHALQLRGYGRRSLGVLQEALAVLGVDSDDPRNIPANAIDVLIWPYALHGDRKRTRAFLEPDHTEGPDEDAVMWKAFWATRLQVSFFEQDIDQVDALMENWRKGAANPRLAAWNSTFLWLSPCLALHAQLECSPGYRRDERIREFREVLKQLRLASRSVLTGCFIPSLSAFDAMLRGRIKKAHRLLSFAECEALRADSPLGLWLAHHVRASVLRQQGDTAGASAAAQSALELTHLHDWPGLERRVRHIHHPER